MNYPTGDSWLPWQRDYRYGALVIEPPRQLAAALDPIRARLDPISAGRVGAHITLTPPFADAPSGAQEERVASTVRGQTTVGLQLGRPTVFSGSSVIYLPVEPRREFDSLRAVLLATGLFRLDLPHTDDFVPHLTLSEFGTSPTSPEEIDVPEPQSMFFLVEAISWLVPDQGFHFTMRRTFPLGPVPLREDETTFRRAVPDDGPTIAEVHARSWPWTYDGLLPAEVIAGVVGEREARGMRLRDAIADESTGQRVWVATREGAVVGFATWSPSQDDDATDTTADLCRDDEQREG